MVATPKKPKPELLTTDISKKSYVIPRLLTNKIYNNKCWLANYLSGRQALVHFNGKTLTLKKSPSRVHSLTNTIQPSSPWYARITLTRTHRILRRQCHHHFNSPGQTFVPSRLEGTINSKINGTSKCFYLPISNLHSILAVSNLLAHNNITITYYVQVNSLRLKLSVVSKWAIKRLWGYHLFCCWLSVINIRLFLCSY